MLGLLSALNLVPGRNRRKRSSLENTQPLITPVSQLWGTPAACWAFPEGRCAAPSLLLSSSPLFLSFEPGSYSLPFFLCSLMPCCPCPGCWEATSLGRLGVSRNRYLAVLWYCEGKIGLPFLFSGALPVSCCGGGGMGSLDLA
jgi:hypothetical protein